MFENLTFQTSLAISILSGTVLLLKFLLLIFVLPRSCGDLLPYISQFRFALGVRLGGLHVCSGSIVETEEKTQGKSKSTIDLGMASKLTKQNFG